MSTSQVRRCVYTALIGNYESLNEQPMAAGSDIPFICLTDDPHLSSDSWQIRQTSVVFGMDPIRSQRHLKLRPHVVLPEFDASLYIDNSVILTVRPEEVFDRYAEAGPFCIPSHSYRERVLDEFLEVARLGFDDQARIFEQLNHYTFECPEVLEQRPYWGGIQLRDHRDETVRRTLEIWLSHVQRYSRRDQLSLNAALRQTGLVPHAIEIDNFASWFHSWPHVAGRDARKGVRLPANSFSTPQAAIRRLELELADRARHHEAVVADHIQLREAVVADHIRHHEAIVADHEAVLAETGRTHAAGIAEIAERERLQSQALAQQAAEFHARIEEMQAVETRMRDRRITLKRMRGALVRRLRSLSRSG